MAYKCPTITILGYTVTCEYVSNNNGKTYTSGQTLPTVDEADEFQIVVSAPDVGDYCMCNFMYFKSNDGKVLAGWTLYDIYVFRDTINYKIPIPSSINGKNVTQYSYYREFGSGLLDSTVADKLITGPVLPSGLKDISGCFKGCVNLQGLLEVNCNPTYYSNWLAGRTSSSPSLKLYGNSTMLSTLASGYSNVSVYIKTQAQLLAQRCNSSHQLDDEGTGMKLSLKIKGDNVGVNYTAAIKVDNSLVMTKGFTLNSSAEQTIVWYIDNTYSVDTTYAVSATITAKCSGQTIETLNVSDILTTAFYTMDFGNNGHQIAFGKPANANASDIPVNGRFDCAMDADFNGTININGIPIKGCHKIRTIRKGETSSYTYDTIGWYMDGAKTVLLEEKVSEQQNGIILVWSYYDKEPKDWSWNFTFIPKAFIADNPSVGGMSTFMVQNATFGSVAVKYIYIKDDSIIGNDNNKASGTGASAIKYANNKFVLRWVYGF